MDFDAQGLALLNARAWLSGLGVFAAAYALGSLICFRVPGLKGVDRVLIRFAAGLALLPILILVIGAKAELLFQFPWQILAWIATGATAGTQIRRSGGFKKTYWAEGRAKLRRAHGLRSQSLTTWVGWLAVIVTVIYLLGPAVCPSLSYDALEYHLGIVTHIFRVRTVAPIPHVFYSAQPIATEMLYTLGAVMEGTPWEQSSGLIQWLILAMCIVLLARVLLGMDVPAALIPWLLLVFVSHPIIFKLTLDRLTDLTGVMFLLAGLLVVFATKEERRISGAILAGLLAGGAVSTKWTNLGTTGVILLLTTIATLECGSLLPLSLRLKVGPDANQEREQAPALQSSIIKSRFAPYFPLAGFFVGFALILTLWMAWVTIHTGNPFAPFLAGLFPTPAWGPERLSFLLETHGPISPLSLGYWKNLFVQLSSLESGPPLFVASLMLLGAAIWLPVIGKNAYARRRIALVSGITVGILLWGRLMLAADRFLAPVVAAEVVLLGAAFALLFVRVITIRTER